MAAADRSARRATAWITALATISFGAAAPAQVDCNAPEPVCATQSAVFAISTGFEPLASAVLVAPGVVVTNRHAVVDETLVTLHREDGSRLQGRVMPTAFRGDLVLVQVPGLDAVPLVVGAPGDSPVYAIGAVGRRGAVRVHAPGAVVALPPPGKPDARIHHTAESGYGLSGGALVDARGRLIAIITAGGQGRHDAIPATRIARLKAMTGPVHSDDAAAFGRLYRNCIESLERAILDTIAESCGATGNRQLIDLAAQAFGQAGHFERSERLFRTSLDIDPNSISSWIGLAVTLQLAGKGDDEAVVLRDLIDRAPDDLRTLWMSIKAGKRVGDQTLIERALGLFSEHHPNALDAAEAFLAL